MTDYTLKTRNTTNYTNVNRNSTTYENNVGFLLNEDTSYILLEGGGRIVLDQSINYRHHTNYTLKNKS
jgi:hypothetical protein